MTSDESSTPPNEVTSEAPTSASPSKSRSFSHCSTAGFRKIEATSFVSPKWVPQLADAAEVMAAIFIFGHVDACFPICPAQLLLAEDQPVGAIVHQIGGDNDFDGFFATFRFNDGAVFAIEQAVIFNASLFAFKARFGIPGLYVDPALINSGRIAGRQGEPVGSIQRDLFDHVGELGFGDIPGWPAELAHGDIAIFCGLRKARRHARLIVISGRGTGSGQSGQEE